MRIFKSIFSFVCVVLMAFSFSSCSMAENDYNTQSKTSSKNTTSSFSVDDQMIMSSDRIMSKYFDISLFDEENYADIYLGKRYKIQSEFAGQTIEVPTTISKMKEKGWNFATGNTYDENSLVFSYETIETVLVNQDGITVTVWFYNSSRSSRKLSECNIVKIYILNDFYSQVEHHNNFNINGIKNSMAITEVIDILGTPSHFYKVSDSLYYLDYFITKKDRRNGITVYINPIEDNIYAIEFAYYK